jgi:hypothetical protein
MARIPVETRFWNKVQKGTAEHSKTECWLWTGAVTSNGYGNFSRDAKQQKAHRVAWELTNGRIPDGLYLCHHCDVKRCVRPDHLFLGTHTENMQDAVSKNQNAFGVRHGRRKLTEAQVREIRETYQPWVRSRSLRALAKRFGVQVFTVSAIVNGQTWQRLGEVA